MHTPSPLSSPFKPLTIRGRMLLPVVQGGMGIGISAHRLAGTVAREGAMGTIASIDLRHHHPDLLAQSKGVHDQATLDALNLVALDREIRAARTLAEGRGMIAVNVMKAVTSHAAYVRQACESGADAIVMGAGLPLDLPELTAGHDIALIPILSDARGIAIVLKRWLRKNRLPDAIVIEHPGHAGGHLGAADTEACHDARFDFPRVLADTRALFADLGIADGAIPLIVAGGVNSHDQVRACMVAGADGVQLGTPFAVTAEGDAHPEFKRILADAAPEDITTFVSVTGLPARAVKTPWLEKYLRNENRLRSKLAGRTRACSTGLNCISTCGLRDGVERFGQFCIDLHLAAALHGDRAKGLFFRGAEALPFGNTIRSVRELLDLLLNDRRPAVLPAAG
ncbi:NAD(P)H-dependent flavin oxidoreductase [Chitinasiproducens palmae]|uniref:Nitronate monooxygenase n=1 Tax=Chitinasiproducens palmae TaxID=1770053 RepID=A0A1H2PNZ7_9BURK|nr:nitronate monooxygenase family protein [Chitinasiproducens palmae]SDV48453.1 nitronate monooxygenase [Chitinasiproducens palmae]